MSATGGGGRPSHAGELEAENRRLRGRLASIEVEFARREEQLYHAVQTAQLWSRTIRVLRQRIRELQLEIAALMSEPWAPRTSRDFDNDGEDWPEHG